MKEPHLSRPSARGVLLALALACMMAAVGHLCARALQPAAPGVALAHVEETAFVAALDADGEDVCSGGAVNELGLQVVAERTFESRGRTGVEYAVRVESRLPDRATIAYTYAVYRDDGEEVVSAPATRAIPLSPGPPQRPEVPEPQGPREPDDINEPPQPPREVGQVGLRLEPNLEDGFYEVRVRATGGIRGQAAKTARFDAASVFVEVAGGDVQLIDGADYYARSRVNEAGAIARRSERNGGGAR